MTNDNTMIDPFHGDAEQPGDKHMRIAEETLDLMCCNVPEVGDVREASIRDIARALAAAEREGMEAGLRRAAEICSLVEQEFLDPHYAFPQPMGSISERFACEKCANTILSELPSTQTTPSVSEQAGEAISAVSPATPYDPFVARHVDPSRAV